MVEGPLAPYLEPYAEYLADRGYSQVSYWKKTFLINEFSRWLSREDIPADEITSGHEEAFLRDRARHRCLKGGDRITLSGVTNWLQEKGIIECRATDSVETSGIDRVLQEYRCYLHEDRGLAPATIENYSGYIRHFLTEISGAAELRLASLHAGQIADYIRRNASKDRTFASAKHIVTALRSFFRFARYRDYIHIDLTAAVPSVAGWSMASIPRAMPTDCVRVLLGASKTWRTPAGLRNRAILLLLARLGLRAGEVVRVELGDIDWSEGCLCVHGKGLVLRRPARRAIGRNDLGFPRPPDRHSYRDGDRCEAAGGGDRRALDEDGRRISVVVVPPPEEGRRHIDRRSHNLEPGRAKLRLEAEPPRGPLRRGPHRREHDREDDEDLAPEDLGGGQICPAAVNGDELRGYHLCPGNRGIGVIVVSDRPARRN